MKDTVYERYRRAKYRSRDSEIGISLLPILFACEINIKGVSIIRLDFGQISETVYIDIILNTIIER